MRPENTSWKMAVKSLDGEEKVRIATFKILSGWYSIFGKNKCGSSQSRSMKDHRLEGDIG